MLETLKKKNFMHPLLKKLQEFMYVQGIKLCLDPIKYMKPYLFNLNNENMKNKLFYIKKIKLYNKFYYIKSAQTPRDRRPQPETH